MREHPQDPANGIWKRRILIHKTSGRVIVLHDHRDCGAVTEHNGEVSRTDVGGQDDDPISFLAHVGLPAERITVQETVHAICHMRTSREGFAKNPENDNPPQPLFDKGITGKWVVALQATTQNSINDTCHLREDAGNSYVWLPMNNREAYRKVDLWLPEFMDLDFATAKAIAEAADRGALDPEIQRKYAHLLDITHPGDATAELAFRLLCESVVLCKGEAFGKVGNILIAAPSQLEQWMVPFSPTGTTDEQKIESLVNMMVSEAAKTAAHAVLQSAKANTGVLESAKRFPGFPAFNAPQQQSVEDAQ